MQNQPEVMNIGEEDVPFVLGQLELFGKRIEELQKGFSDLSEQITDAIEEMS